MSRMWRHNILAGCPERVQAEGDDDDHKENLPRELNTSRLHFLEVCASDVRLRGAGWGNEAPTIFPVRFLRVKNFVRSVQSKCCSVI